MKKHQEWGGMNMSKATIMRRTSKVASAQLEAVITSLRRGTLEETLDELREMEAIYESLHSLMVEEITAKFLLEEALDIEEEDDTFSVECNECYTNFETEESGMDSVTCIECGNEIGLY